MKFSAGPADTTMNDSDGLNFIIVGASVVGLASAIALKASGHNVVVLEKDPQLGGTDSTPNGCARVALNGCKILFDWGLQAETMANAANWPGFWIYNYNENDVPGRDFIGLNRTDPELLSEGRGEDFVTFRHKELLRILYEKAVAPAEQKQSNSKMKGRQADSGPRVVVLFGAEVLEVDCNACSVTLRSGEVHTGDAIIGADGPRGIIRRTLMEEEDVEEEEQDGALTGTALYSTVVPRVLALKDPDLASFCSEPTVNMGSNRAAVTAIVGKERDIGLFIYTPDSAQDGAWTDNADRSVADIVGPCDIGMRKLAALAEPASSCIQIRNHYDLESWVSESGRVLALGEAANPFPPGALHAYSIALEDSAFIGKIFSHTRSRDRIPEFLYAFQEHREPRRARIREIEKQYIVAITLPDGEMQEGRDAAMRANQAVGRNALDAPESDLGEMYDDMRMIFGYDAADDADEWWMAWGRFRDSPEVRVNHLNGFGSAVVSSLTIHDSDDEDSNSVNEGYAS